MANNAELSQLIEDELKKQGYYDGHSKLRKQDDRDRDEEKALMGALRVEARVKEHQHQKTILTMKRSICIGGGLLVVVILWVVLALKSKSANQAVKGGPDVVMVTPRPNATFSPPPSSQSKEPTSSTAHVADTGKTSSTDLTSPVSSPPPPASKTSPASHPPPPPSKTASSSTHSDTGSQEPPQSDSSDAEQKDTKDKSSSKDNWSWPPSAFEHDEVEEYDYPELTDEEIEEQERKYEDYFGDYMYDDDYSDLFSGDDDEGRR